MLRISGKRILQVFLGLAVTLSLVFSLTTAPITVHAASAFAKGVDIGWLKQLEDRGVIRPGAYADLVLFDPEELDPGVDYRDQAPPPKGVRWVFLNGQPVLKEGEMTYARAGKVLYAYGHRKP